jgi:hypothetical protein
MLGTAGRSGGAVVPLVCDRTGGGLEGPQGLGG